MNKTFYLLIFLLFIFSCSNYTLHTGTEYQKSITNIPLLPHQQNVDVYFNNEQPTQPYYKVKMIDASGPTNASYETLLKTLKQEAAAAGLDGVLVLEKHQAIEYNNISESRTIRDTTISIERQEANTYQTISAIGLKYAGNIKYLDTIVKSTIIDIYEDGKARKLNIQFDYYGNMLNATDKKAAQFYGDDIAPFDIQKQDAASVPGWEYSFDEFNQLLSFRISNTLEVVASARIERSGTGRIDAVQYKIKDPVSKKNIRYTLQCIYNSAGKLVVKQLLNKNKLLWVEKINYKENTITGYSRYSSVGETERLVFKADNYFFSQADLPKPIDGTTAGISK